MLHERTIHQIRMSKATPERAKDIGRMGYMQWLGGLPGHSSYEAEAVRAYLLAMDHMESDPAIAEFCDLIRKSLRTPLRPLDLPLPKPQRRGGARVRRSRTQV